MSVSNVVSANAASANAKYMSIIPENGQEFVAGQKIVFNIDPSLGFIKSKDSYLVFDVLNNTPNVRTCLANAGVSSLISQVNIYSKNSGMLLESLNNYNQWVATELQYKEDDWCNYYKHEGVPKPVQSQMVLGVANAGAAAKEPNWRKSWAYPENNVFSAIDTNGNPCFTSVRYTTPLRCGLFRTWDDEKLLPVMMLGGLRIELVLEENQRSLIIPSAGSHLAAEAGCERVRNLTQGYEQPFVDHPNGIKLCNNAINGAADSKDDPSSLFTENPMKITDCGLCVGQRITILNGAAGPANLVTTITAINVVNGIANTGAPAGNGGAAAIDGRVQIKIANALTAALANEAGRVSSDDANSADIKYKITSAEFRLLVEQPPNQIGNMSYEFTSYDLFRDNIPSTPLNFQSDITSVASKACAMFSMYVDPKTDNVSNSGNRNGYYVGLQAGEAGFPLNSVVYFINNRLYPLRPYDPRPLNDKVINVNELVKAWKTLGVNVKTIGSAERQDLDAYTNRYLHARELARKPAYSSLVNAEPQIRLTFAGARGNDYHGDAITNVSMLTYVFSKKTINIDASGLSLVM